MVNEFLIQHHKKFSAPEGLVFDIVKDVTGKTPIRRQKLIVGVHNEVYSISTKEDEEFIVRINRKGGISFRLEQWAIELCRKHGVPVPKIFSIDDLKIKGKGYEVMVQEKLKGSPLSDIIKQREPTELNAILKQVGAILGKIHSIQVSGFYHRHIDGTWDFPDWDAFMNCALRDRISEKEHVLNAGFSKKQFEFMVDMIKYYKNEFPCNKPVLNHGDFEPMHIFVDLKNRVSGIIDFGDIQGNVPVHDLAQLNLAWPTLNIEAIKTGYREKTLFDKNFDTKLNLDMMLYQMGLLAYHDQIGDKKGKIKVANHLKNTIRFLRHIK